MTHRERILAALRGGPLDRLPWVPRLLLWYNAHRRQRTLPHKYQRWSLREIEKDLKLGTPARDGKIFESRLQGVEITTSRKGNDLLTEYHTPVGTLSTLYRESEQLQEHEIQGREIQHLIKGPEDYPVMEYIIEHTEYIPTFEEFERYDREIGEDGLPLVLIGDCPMNRLMRELVGYNRIFFDLADYPSQVESLLAVMEDKHREMWSIAAQSPATLLLYGLHFDSQMTPPPLFRRYFLPHFQQFNRLMHQHGKYGAFHADADSSLLLDLLLEAEYDCADTFTCAPMVKVTLAEARAAWGKRITIWGGIPSIILGPPFSEKEFEDYMEGLFRTIAPGDAFILGVGDNVMPEAQIERVARVSQMVQEWGRFPIQPPSGIADKPS
jgi:uroporphyrinogen-III decarboxylase